MTAKHAHSRSIAWWQSGRQCPTCSPGNGDDKGAQAIVVVVLLGQLLLGQLHDCYHLLGQHLQMHTALLRTVSALQLVWCP